MDTLKVAWLYPDLLELYGDRGNILALQYRARELGVKVEVDHFSVGENFSPKEYDLVFLGGGADRDQSIFYDDLVSRRSQIIEAIEDDVAFLLICGGYQLFGKYYIDAHGEKLDGLGIFQFYSKAGEKRNIGYLTVECNIDGNEIYLSGFENHGGQTYDVSSPLGTVLSGAGNNTDEDGEGFLYKKVIGTYLHGPLLSRNPELTDIILGWMAKRHDMELDFSKGDVTFEKMAKRQVMREQGLLE
ncbi:MAG: type 1 glutamine amidotransferase [Culicoidibacterales bacterium]